LSRLISGPREGWLTLLLSMAITLCPALSLASADWVEDLWVVPWLAFVSLLLGTVLAKLPVRWPVAHLFSVEIGLLVVATLFAKMPQGAPWGERILWLWDRIRVWFEIVFGGGISNDTMLFALLMALLAWFLGYLTAWFIFRRHNPWPPMVLCGSVLLVNLSYLESDPGLFFVVYLLASMLLLLRLTAYEKEKDWERVGAGYTPEWRWRLLRGGVLLSIAVMLLGWAMPVGHVNAVVAENWYRWLEPWEGFQSEFDRLFAVASPSASRTEDDRFGRSLALGGVVELGTEPVMLVASPKPGYWGAQAYDKYTGQGWLSTADKVTRLDAGDQKLSSSAYLYRGRQEVEQRFKWLGGRTRLIYATGSPVRFGMPVFAEHFETLEDIEAIKTIVPLRQGQQYGVISSISVASQTQLRQADAEYPEWTQRYLELPERSLRRVVSQARRITRGADTRYDAALAIEQYLRGLRYESTVPEPPPHRDAVDWFLFTTRAGYCDYFASAMAVMARAVGIPSRVVSGYNTGNFNQETGLYEVRAEHAHSWPELFFPGYGWIRFEPTPSQSLPERVVGSTEEFELEDDFPEVDLEALGFEVEVLDPLLLEDDLSLFYEDTSPAVDTGELSTESSRNPVVLAMIGGILAFVIVWWYLLSKHSPARRAYFQIHFIASMLGWKIRASHTPLEYAGILAKAAPRLRTELDSVVRSYVRETYGAESPQHPEVSASWRRLQWRLPLELIRNAITRKLSSSKRIIANR
jgi:transglutaminase-like putative cysteine protease